MDTVSGRLLQVFNVMNFLYVSRYLTSHYFFTDFLGTLDEQSWEIGRDQVIETSFYYFEPTNIIPLVFRYP